MINNTPKNWELTKLKQVIDVSRGGSPRPIESFLTEDPLGINWIKISDATGNGKFITSAKQRIRKEGVSRSRYVKSGDLLLTNSMSFGHPYILKINGCIHDGWLVLSIKGNIFIQEYLYYLLLSPLMYSQFCGKVSGGVVKNLNIEKVINSFVLIPPIDEQTRILYKLGKLESVIDERF